MGWAPEERSGDVVSSPTFRAGQRAAASAEQRCAVQGGSVPRENNQDPQMARRTSRVKVSLSVRKTAERVPVHCGLNYCCSGEKNKQLYVGVNPQEVRTLNMPYVARL